MLYRKLFSCFFVFAIVFAGLGISGKAEGIGGLSSLSAVLYEPQSGRVLYEKDAHKTRPMASTTKIMTALVAIEQCPLDQIVTVTAEAVRVEGSALGLRAGDQITMVDLITGLLLESGNDAANVVAYTVAGGIPAFAAMMNERAAALGMRDTLFVTPSGLDEGEHSSTAYDMALLAAEGMRNETIAAICDKESAVISFGNPPRKITVSNHNRLLQLYPYAVGMKTGFTKKSGRCLVSAAEKDGVQLIAVTLNAGDDWNDHIAMYEYGFSKTEAVPLPLPDLPKVAVSGGLTAQVPIVMDSPPVFILLKEEKDSIKVNVELPRFVLAPVALGESLGAVQYVLDDKVLCTLPISACNEVLERPVAGYWQRYSELLLSLFTELLS